MLVAPVGGCARPGAGDPGGGGRATARSDVRREDLTGPGARGLLLAGAGVLALSGCGLVQKQSPNVTLYSSGSYTDSTAAVYCYDGDVLPDEVTLADGGRIEGTDCRADLLLDEGDQPPVLEVDPFEPVSISVDQSLFDGNRTWGLAGAEGSVPERLRTVDDYFLQIPAVSPEDLPNNLVVESRTDDGVVGRWVFRLEPSGADGGERDEPLRLPAGADDS